MTKLKSISLVLAFVLLGFANAHAISFTVGQGNYYVNVGDYDYLPYAYQANPSFAAPPINFQSMMGQYGNWTSMQPFGQVWQPYVSQDWRPYTQGRWIYTQQYGPYWQGYEPWAWAAYHYGNWAYSQQGWVWIPGYQFTPGNVTWAQGYDTIGWMPTPPQGYDYSRGYLSYAGPNNQFNYHDQDFGVGFGAGNPYVSYGGPYYDPRYRNSYYNPSFLQTALNLFTFIATSNFNSDNYANYYLPPDYTRYVFDQRLVRISARPIERVVLERIVRQPIQEVAVQVKTIQTDKQPIQVVIPASDTSVEEIRRNASVVVRDVIAPAFAEKQRAFKGEQAQHRDVVNKIFHQENVKPQVETVDSTQIVQKAKQDRDLRQQRRAQGLQQAKEKIDRVVREGKVRPNKREKEKGAGSQGTPQGPPERPNVNERPNQKPNEVTNEEQNQNEPRKKKPQNVTNDQSTEQQKPGKGTENVEKGQEKTDQGTVEENQQPNKENAQGKEKNKETGKKSKKNKDKKEKNTNSNEEQNPPQR